jgi:hypothetical protein
MNSVQNFKITACAACDGSVNAVKEEMLPVDETIMLQYLQSILNKVNYNTSFVSRRELTAINRQQFSLDEILYTETIRVDGISTMYDRKYFQIPWHAMENIDVEGGKPYLSKLRISFTEKLSYIDHYEEYKDRHKKDLQNTNEVLLFLWEEDVDNVMQALLNLRQLAREKME